MRCADGTEVTRERTTPDRVPPYVTRNMAPSEAIEFVVGWLDTEPDDEMLELAAMTMLEPLVDWHWRTIERELLALLAERADLRKVVRICWFDASTPDEVAERIYSAAQAD